MDQFYLRKYIISGLILLTIIIFLVRLFLIQVVDNQYKLSAENNVIRQEMQYPARGLIFDRNGKLLVSNEAAYDIMFNPRNSQPFDTADFCNILDISREQVKERINKAKAYSSYKPSVFLKQISSKTYAILQEKMYSFPSFFVQPRPIRYYTDTIAAHILGYVGEVDKRTIEKDFYFEMGDYIGISGIEKAYDTELRGEKGVRLYLVDVHNRIKGTYKDGRYDTPARVGDNLITTIDADLQKYGEKLMQRKIGGIVAIEPSSGELLSMVSSPAYNPDLLVGRKRTRNFTKLSRDTLEPLFNRAVMAQYPPGSTFKVINGLIALNEKVIRPETKFECSLGYYAGGIKVGCHRHDSPLDLVRAVQNSCNSYFIHTFRRILDRTNHGTIQESYTNWRNHVTSFGFGKRLEVDLPNEVKGIIPTYKFYNNVYGERGWSSLTLYSLAIGQGEISTTPLQMANIAAAIANRGFYYTPHIIINIEGKPDIDEEYKEPIHTSIDSSDFEPIIEGMDLAVNGGWDSGSTAWRARMQDITICGKTGTAENPHGEDHSIFIAFAPRENPEIAISVYVENGGYGNYWAAPIARLMIEKYLKDTISRPDLEKYVLDVNLLNRRDKKD